MNEIPNKGRGEKITIKERSAFDTLLTTILLDYNPVLEKEMLPLKPSLLQQAGLFSCRYFN